MHAFFAAMFLDSPDYFDARALNDDERAAYDELAVLLAGWITDPVSYAMARPAAELREREAAREARLVATITEALEPLIASGRTIVPPHGIVLAAGLKATAIGVDVEQTEAPMDDILPVVEALHPVAEVVDWFYLVPIRDGVRLSDGAYSVAAHRLRDVADSAQWDQRELTAFAMSLALPTAVPPEVVPLLPDLPLASTPPGPSLVQRSVGLHRSAEVYARRRRQIDAIGGGAPLSDHLALRSELQSALSDVEDELRSLAATLRDEVERRFAAESSSTARAAAATLSAMADDVDLLLAAARGNRTLVWRWAAEVVEQAARALELDGGLSTLGGSDSSERG